MTVPYDHALSADRNHDAAALALARKLGWLAPLGHTFDLVRGSGARGRVYVFAHGGAFGEIVWCSDAR